jgi:hypothetical protein
MPEISRFYGIVISIYFKDHSPPHFHADYGEFSAQFGIRDLKILEGTMPKRVKNLVLEWADDHRDELMTAWSAVQAGEPFSKIEPLQ